MVPNRGNYKNKRLSLAARKRQPVTRAYGGSLSGSVVKLRIIRAFLSEECRIATKYRRAEKLADERREKKQKAKKKSRKKGKAKKGGNQRAKSGGKAKSGAKAKSGGKAKKGGNQQAKKKKSKK